MLQARGSGSVAQRVQIRLRWRCPDYDVHHIESNAKLRERGARRCDDGQPCVGAPGVVTSDPLLIESNGDADVTTPNSRMDDALTDARPCCLEALHFEPDQPTEVGNRIHWLSGAQRVER